MPDEVPFYIFWEYGLFFNQFLNDVLSKNTMAGTTPVVLNVAPLPAGPYVVRCTAGEKTGMRRVTLGE